MKRFLKWLWGQKSDLPTLLKTQIRLLIHRTEATGNPPTKEEIESLQALQTLNELREKTQYRISRWLILTGSLVIAIGVSYLALKPYPELRLYVTARAKEIDFHVRYQDVFERFNISQLRLYGVALSVDDALDPISGDFSVSGGSLKPQPYTHFANGTLSVKYDIREGAHLVTVRAGPGCLNRISASISGASAVVRLPSGAAVG
jgi:hypothetical protein